MASKINLPHPSYSKTLLSSPPTQDPSQVTSTTSALSLQPHPEGGFFVETDRDPRLVPNPFFEVANEQSSSAGTPTTDSSTNTPEENSVATVSNDANRIMSPNNQVYNQAIANKGSLDKYRHASTSIHYFLTPSSPLGRFHRNKARTVHTLHSGRGAYVVLYPPEDIDDGAEVEHGESGKGGGSDTDGKGERQWRVETFMVGKDVSKGEKLQWVVEGGRYKASYLLPDTGNPSQAGGEDGEGESEAGLLISETVIPGFEYSDHDFLTAVGFLRRIGQEGEGEMGWLLGKEEGRKLASIGRRREQCEAAHAAYRAKRDGGREDSDVRGAE